MLTGSLELYFNGLPVINLVMRHNFEVMCWNTEHSWVVCHWMLCTKTNNWSI